MTYFVDGATLSVFPKIISELIDILEREYLIIVDWFQVNKMRVNLGKFQALIIHGKRQGHINRQVLVNTQNSECASC